MNNATRAAKSIEKMSDEKFNALREAVEAETGAELVFRSDGVGAYINGALYARATGPETPRGIRAAFAMVVCELGAEHLVIGVAK
jgi:hypothetical protein